MIVTFYFLSHSSCGCWSSYSILRRFNVLFIPLLFFRAIFHAGGVMVYAFGNYQISRIISGNSFTKKVCFWQYAKVKIFHYTFISFLPHQGTKRRPPCLSHTINLNWTKAAPALSARNTFTQQFIFSCSSGRSVVKETEADFHVFGANQKMNFTHLAVHSFIQPNFQLVPFSTHTQYAFVGGARAWGSTKYDVIVSTERRKLNKTPHRRADRKPGENSSAADHLNSNQM